MRAHVILIFLALSCDERSTHAFSGVFKANRHLASQSPILSPKCFSSPIVKLAPHMPVWHHRLFNTPNSQKALSPPLRAGGKGVSNADVEVGSGGDGGGESCVADTVEVGDFVVLHYLGELEDNEEFDSTYDREPVEFEVGSGRVIPGLDKAILGMRVGESRDVVVQCEDAFGLRRASRILNVSTINLPFADLYVGKRLGIRGLPSIVTHVYDRLPWVQVDANHPLAGEDLYMTVELLNLTKSSCLETATFFCGNSWALEIVMQRLSGVVSTQSGYTLGTKSNPVYSEVQTGRTGHSEAVQVRFHHARYRDLVTAFLFNADIGYFDRQRKDGNVMDKIGICYHSEAQKSEAEFMVAGFKASKGTERYGATGETIGNIGLNIEVLPNATFWRAEERYQQYLEKTGQLATKGAVEPVYCLDEKFVGPYSGNDQSPPDSTDDGFDVDSDDDRDDHPEEGANIESHSDDGADSSEEAGYEGGGDDERDTYPYWL